MPTFLKNLEIDEISFVDAGANQHAKVVLYKRAEPADPIDTRLAELDALVADVTKAGRKISAARLTTLANLRDALAALIADTTPADKEDKEPEPMEKKADLTKLSKAAQDVLAAIGVAEISEAHAAALDAAMPKALDDKPKVEDVLKSAPPELRALVEKAQADVAKAQAEAEAASKIAKAERDQRVTREFIVKAQGLDALPGMNADDFGVVLKGIAEKAPEDWAKLEPLLKSAHAAIKTGALYGEKGRGGEGGGSAEAEITAKATELVAKSATKLTLDEAKVQLLETAEGKALYQRYLDDNPKQTGR